MSQLDDDEMDRLGTEELVIPWTPPQVTIQAVPMRGGDLQPGDLFSTVGPAYWSRMTWHSIGERVYIRTNAATPVEQQDEPIFKITIIREIR
jgi:hypothetical protein